MLCRLTWLAVTREPVLVAETGFSWEVSASRWTAGKGEYFDIQPLSAFADFRTGPVVSTGLAPHLVHYKLVGAADRSIGNQVRPAGPLAKLNTLTSSLKVLTFGTVERFLRPSWLLKSFWWLTGPAGKRLQPRLDRWQSSIL